MEEITLSGMEALNLPLICLPDIVMAKILADINEGGNVMLNVSHFIILLFSKLLVTATVLSSAVTPNTLPHYITQQ